ncbi:MAG: NAD(P)H-dependent glycerol-3-phosphate dehydrogenase [Planctomycetota bacterium]
MTQPPGAPTVAVIGAGQMGLVCAGILSGEDGRASVRVWGHDPDEVGHIAQTRRSDRLPGYTLPEAAFVHVRPGPALEGAKLIISAVPVQSTREAWTQLAPMVPDDAAIVSVAKGIEHRTEMRPTQIIADALGHGPAGEGRGLAVLSGPTIAAELARCLPATMISASTDPALARLVQELFSTSWMRVYTHHDVLGVELAGALKNVIAIAAGVLDGLGAGFNAKSALLARGLAEITRLGTAMGAEADTFFGIAGVGDLATTCFSPEGRNRSCGEALGQGESLESYIKRSTMVVEGVSTTRAVVDLARTFGVDMPLVHAVNEVLFEGLDPLTAIGGLMSRELKAERLG